MFLQGEVLFPPCEFFWKKLRSFKILISALERVEDIGPSPSLLIPVRSESFQSGSIAAKSGGGPLLVHLNPASFQPPAGSPQESN